MLAHLLLQVLLECTCLNLLMVNAKHHRRKHHHDDQRFEKASIRMPHIAPKKMDSYFCVAHKLPTDERYIVKYEPAAKMQVAHHMLLFGCGEPYQEEKSWSCRDMAPVCAGGKQSIMYAWAKDAGELSMPKDVGMHVGGKSGFNYLVLQVHYLNVSSFEGGATDNSGVAVTLDKHKKDRLAGIYLLGGGWPPIPPHVKKAHIDMGCFYPSRDGPTFTAFRFRVHAHKLGSVITGYRVRDDKWTLIGRGDPQKPQAFYPTDQEIDMKPGDTLMGRCTFNSEKRNRTTYIGATHNDEMCNFYVMYHYDPKTHGEMDYMPCGYPTNKYFHSYPQDSDTPKKEEMFHAAAAK